MVSAGKRLAAALMVALCLGGPALAQDRATLQITDPAHDLSARLTLQDLDALAQITFTTTTIWTDGEVTFSGPALSGVIASVGLRAEEVKLTALNDYAVVMPAPVAGEGAPIIATRMNGETMTVRDKGPFWIVYPYDRDKGYRSEVIYTRSIWQLDRIAASN